MNDYKIALACVAVLFVSTPVMAKGGGNNCAPDSSQGNPAQIQNCLERMNNPSSVKERQAQEKRGRCEQNAKNRDLQGNARSTFIASCMNENEAAKAHASVTQGRPYQAPQQTSSRHSKPAAAKTHTQSRNSCVAQANKRHLKGSKRRDFLKSCH